MRTAGDELDRHAAMVQQAADAAADGPGTHDDDAADIWGGHGPSFAPPHRTLPKLAEVLPSETA